VAQLAYSLERLSTHPLAEHRRVLETVSLEPGFLASRKEAGSMSDNYGTAAGDKRVQAIGQRLIDPKIFRENNESVTLLPFRAAFDDIELHADGERITHTKAACVLGASWFKNHTAEQLHTLLAPLGVHPRPVGGAVFGDPGGFYVSQKFSLGGVQYGEPLRGYEEFSITPVGFIENTGGSQTAAAPAHEEGYRPLSLWWYVMLLAFITALAEISFASRYMGTQREEI
jgi:hypothetical protein